MAINRCIISGNLTRDAEVRYTSGGTAIASFGVAVNDRRKNPQTGEWEDYPNFIDCAMFGKRAESLSPHLTKGLKVAIEGKLRQSTWTTNDGQKRSKVEVMVDEIELMRQQQPRQQQQPQTPWQQTDPQQARGVYDDDIPF